MREGAFISHHVWGTGRELSRGKPVTKQMGVENGKKRDRGKSGDVEKKESLSTSPCIGVDWYGDSKQGGTLARTDIVSKGEGSRGVI